MPFKNRIRLPFYLSRAQFPMERNVFRRADGSAKVLSMIVRHTYQGFTDHLPEGWHKKLTIALAHDSVTIEGDNYLGDVALDGDYQIEWQDFLDNPVAPATFQIQVTPFDATNSNCVSCSQISQLALVDDTVSGALGDSEEASINVFENDSICCYPAVPELVYTNPAYIINAYIQPDGVVEFESVAAAPVISNVKVATYRVTCEDGTYDEADIYASFNGSGGEVCCQPENVSFDSNTNTISWEADCDPVNGFDYDFRQASSPGVVLFSGNAPGADRSIVVPEIVTANPSEYIFNIYSVCESSQSATTTFNFNIPIPSGECQAFNANYSAISGPSSATFSYMNCSGDIVNQVVTRFNPVNVCAAISSLNNPIYWASDQPDSSFSPLGACGPSACEIWMNTSEENAVDLTYISCEGDLFEGVTITPGSAFCAQHDSLSGEGISLMTNMGLC
jgi:hypothetical protein